MDDIIPKVIAAILGAIIIGAFKSYFFTRRLYLIQPKLFDYSDLASAKNAKTVELTIFNGGAKSEEKISVQLSPIFTYTVVASNRAGLVVNDGVLEIERIAPREDVTLVLTAEGGEFRKEHVVGVTSKDTVGKIKASLQDAQFTPAQNVFIPLMIFIVFPLGGYLLGKLAESEFGELSWFQSGDLAAADKSIAYEQRNKRVSLVSMGSKDAKAVGTPYAIVAATRSADYVTIEIDLHNPTKDRLEITVISSTPVSEQREDHWLKINPTVSDVMVFPGVKKRVKVVDFLPLEADPSLINLHFVVNGEGGRVDFKEDVFFKIPPP